MSGYHVCNFWHLYNSVWQCKKQTLDTIIFIVTRFVFYHGSNRCTKIINADSEDPKYIINVKQFAKFVVDLSDQVAPTDIEEGMRVG